MQTNELATKLLIVLLRDGLEQRERHLVPDDRCRLEQPLVLGQEPIDPSCQDGLNGGRDLNRPERFHQAMGSAFADQGLGLHQGPHALLEEEGIALGPLDEKLLERLECAVGTQEGLEEVLSALGAQRVKPELRVVGLAAPQVLVFGAVVDEQEKPGGGQALDEAIQEDLGLGVDPVQVLEEQYERLDLALPEQQTLHGVVVVAADPTRYLWSVSIYVPYPEALAHCCADSTLVPSPHSFNVVISCHGALLAIIDCTFVAQRAGSRARRGDVSPYL